MQSSKLDDSTGEGFLCTALGRHADEDGIAQGNRVILFFANAQRGLNSSPGQIWLHDEGHVVLLRTNCSTPPARLQMEMRGDR